MEKISTESMVWLALMAACAAVFLALRHWRQRRQGAGAATRYGRPRTLDAVDTVIGWAPEATRVLNLSQQRAMDLLQRALPGHLILASVPLSQFIRVPTRNSYLEWLRRIGHVAVDLMVCDRASNVIAVIEVRAADRVESERTRKRRMRVDRVLRAAGIPLHVWNEALLPELAAIRKAFAPEMGAQPAEPDLGPETSPMPLPGVPLRQPDAGAPRGVGPARRDPPRSTWFDELHGTRPMHLDNVEVITHDEIPGGAAHGLLHAAPQPTAR